MDHLPLYSALRKTAACGVAALALTLAAGQSLADEARLEQALAPAELPAPVQSATLATLGTATAVPESLLGSESAMARIELGSIVINDQDVDGVVQGNIATGTTNGNNTISDNAFAGADGFATAIQNTGNNVLIQNSTIINVSLDP
jgi:hypothetical protein